MPQLSRRSLLQCAASLFVVAPKLSFAQTAPAMYVLKVPNCGCCEARVQILKSEGLEVTTEAGFGTLLIGHKPDNGIPQEMISCHTGEIDDYFVEGHVPPADVRRLLDEHHDAVGLAVPGMPYGSPRGERNGSIAQRRPHPRAAVKPASSLAEGMRCP